MFADFGRDACDQHVAAATRRARAATGTHVLFVVYTYNGTYINCSVLFSSTHTSLHFKQSSGLKTGLIIKSIGLTTYTTSIKTT